MITNKNNKIKLDPNDSIQEKKCKKIFNNNYFGVFANNYEKFKNYSILIGSYQNMKYISNKYHYYYIKEHYPEFIEPEEFIVLNNVLSCEGCLDV
jgi:hypothetical protein